MIPIAEFLALRGTTLDVQVLDHWQNAVDSAFVAYVLEHHQTFDYQHLRCALRILKNVNRDDVRDLFRYYADNAEPGYRTLARGSLKEQLKRGWISKPVAAQ